MTENDVFEKLKSVMVSEFEVDESKITLEATFFEDLNFDSIDAVDLIVKMKDYIPEGKGPIDPSVFQSVRTIQDVITVLMPYLS